MIFFCLTIAGGGGVAIFRNYLILRLKASSRKTVLRTNPVEPDSQVFFDARVLLGTKDINQTERDVRLVGYKADGKNYWVTTDRFYLSADQIALIYKLRWTIESFFGWWKHHLKVYHLIARSPYGLLMQSLSGLITYLLLAIYCHEEHGERVIFRIAPQDPKGSGCRRGVWRNNTTRHHRFGLQRVCNFLTGHY